MVLWSRFCGPREEGEKGKGKTRRKGRRRNRGRHTDISDIKVKIVKRGESDRDKGRQTQTSKWKRQKGAERPIDNPANKNKIRHKHRRKQAVGWMVAREIKKVEMSES